ncbi:dihydropteroate synthase [Cellulosilyticum sp. I15G10I2]|uniref:dihydropteroate synthase n=1 Tax=Cellulosilyticum sp. I15G10I2 TaxID=1892843 RepID=UPI00085C213D|nr:dihydropteroate synthase [Cellulosilyticum sp. I15G10I2]
MLIGNKEFDLDRRTYIMGILNVTPDSFSDGGRFNTLDTAASRVDALLQEGADIIDIGGESTRPNHTPVEENEEIQRVVPIIKRIREKFDCPISIDTYKAKVAEKALLAGADIINDVWGFKKDNDLARVAAQFNVPCILMHNRQEANYKTFIEDMKADLMESIEIAYKAGVKKENIILDPGIGFAKTYEQNLQAMKELEQICNMGFPVLLGTSRKSMIGLTLDLPVGERLEGTIATTVMGIMKGCKFIRVHDVEANKRAAVMTDAMIRGVKSNG